MVVEEIVDEDEAGSPTGRTNDEEEDDDDDEEEEEEEEDEEEVLSTVDEVTIIDSA